MAQGLLLGCRSGFIGGVSWGIEDKEDNENDKKSNWRDSIHRSETFVSKVRVNVSKVYTSLFLLGRFLMLADVMVSISYVC